MGVGPLSHQEIECWSRLMRLDPPISPFEVEVLRKLDRECRSYHATKNDEPPKSIVAALKDRKDIYAAEQAAKEKKKGKRK